MALAPWRCGADHVPSGLTITLLLATVPAVAPLSHLLQVIEQAETCSCIETRFINEPSAPLLFRLRLIVVHDPGSAERVPLSPDLW